MSFAQNNHARVELYIDQGEQQNKQIFDWLHARKENIEAQIDETLSWERIDDRRGSRIAVYRPSSILDD